ncbi:MAG TPA: Asp-tRNA(Asn)/Glu-tRNA(Gln) amidotransferase subunit GatB [Ferruginibacter sp.]|nr:Asp-tRNA(Asn)/Glu-tRNA(Gln) amidotransferase subunit GatB [Ferruginibacter sp.]
MKNLDKYEVVIGLEVHAQLLTKSKLFSGDSIAFGAAPNTQVSPISLAHPGTLPVMNKEVMNLAIRLGLALNCDIARNHYFARKNYFYPDLPKGYQVSQHTTPICNKGFLEVQVGDAVKTVHLHHIHMEEDAGKSIHDMDEDYTFIDLNRAGTPLLEIVTEPCIHSSDEAFAFLTALRRLVRWMDVCDGNMEEGSMRCDANISIRPKGETKLGTRVEVKNLNSIRNVKRAIDAEVQRLVSIVENGEEVIQQTRSFDADKGTTFSLRNKEEADDYRYFPEPDLPAFFISDEQLHQVRRTMPLGPQQTEQLFKNKYALSQYDAAVICSDKDDAKFYSDLVAETSHYKAAANWMLGPLKAYCNEQQISFGEISITPVQIASLINFTESGAVSFSIASTRLLQAMLSNGYIEPHQLATQMNLLQESDTSLIESWVKQALESMPDKVKEYRSGKKGLIGLFAGQVKKISKGKADMQQATKILEQQLNQ